MNDSILVSIKKMLGIDKDYDAFDVDVLININTIMSVLYQLGVDSAKDFRVNGIDESWSDLSDDPILLDLIKDYIYLRVRILFDPPNNSFLLSSISDQIKEFEWRINIQAEGGFKDEE